MKLGYIITLLLILSTIECSLKKKGFFQTTSILNGKNERKLRSSLIRNKRLDLFTKDPSLLPGKNGFVINGKEYLVESALPKFKGGFGEVYFAKNIKDNSQVVIKVLINGFPSEDEYNITINTVKLLKEKNPKYIVKIDDVLKADINGSTKGLILLEYINGRTLKELFKTAKDLTNEQLNCVISSLIFAGYELYKLQILHFDIKALNIMVDETDPKCPIAKIIDIDDKPTLSYMTEKLRNFKMKEWQSEEYLDLHIIKHPMFRNPNDSMCSNSQLAYQPLAYDFNCLLYQIVFLLLNHSENAAQTSQLYMDKIIAEKNLKETDLVMKLINNLDYRKNFAYENIESLNTILDGALEKMDKLLYKEIKKDDLSVAKSQLQDFLNEFNKDVGHTFFFNTHVGNEFYEKTYDEEYMKSSILPMMPEYMELSMTDKKVNFKEITNESAALEPTKKKKKWYHFFSKLKNKIKK